MKIAYLFSRYPVPSQTFCDTEIRALEAAGHEVEIYVCSAPTTSFRHDKKFWPRAEVLYAPPATVLEAWEAGARREGTWPSGMVAEHRARFGTRYDPARRARHAIYFADRLRRRGVEHLHVHFANRATHAALFTHALTGVPYSFTAHAQDFLVDLGSDDLLRLMCEQAAFVVTVSDWSRGALIERCPNAAAKVHRIYNGLALEHWPLPDPQPASATGKILRILSVGRLIEFKGFQDLIAACRLLQQRGVPFDCEIVGDGPLRAHLEGQATGLNEDPARVSLTGLLPQNEVLARLRACDVFALASRTDEKGACDVLPTVILEAMAAAKPVISTQLAGIPEMVEPGHTGLLVPPGDSTALANALEWMAGKTAERSKMGEAGHRKLKSKFSAAESARMLGGLFAKAAANSAFVPTKTVETVPRIPILCLFDRWPAGNMGSGVMFSEQTLLALRSSQRNGVWLALKAGEFADVPGAVPQRDPVVLRDFEFLPEAVVLETGWRHHAEHAYRLESWRGEVGGAYDQDEFLLACRRALYLWQRFPVLTREGYHLHAVGRSALLCGWLLRRLEAVSSASFLLPPPPGGGTGVGGSTLRKLAPAFTGGWVVEERKLAESLGATFQGEKFEDGRWLQALERWSCLR